MSDDDPHTIDHDRREKSPKDRRWTRLMNLWSLALVAFMWWGAWETIGPDKFDWYQIALGGATIAFLLLAVLNSINIDKPYRDYFK